MKIDYTKRCIIIYVCVSSFFSGCSESVVQEDQKLATNNDTCLKVLFATPAYEYNEILSKYAVKLAFDAEEETSDRIMETYTSGEFGLTNVEAYYYSTSGGAHVIGWLQTEYLGETYSIIVITARGSITPQEFIGDYAKGGERTVFGNYSVYNNVYDFEEKIWKSLMSYLSNYPSIYNSDKVKILITGHSLGGAAANMLAARLDSEIVQNDELSLAIATADVYCYTYGAIKVLSSDENVEIGFENIHNVYNYYDTFGPNGGMSGYRASSPYSKFGHTEMYYKQESEDFMGTENHMNYYDVVNNPAGIEFYTCINHQLEEISEEDNNAYESEPVDNATIESGTYVSTDGYNQEFIFSDSNKVQLTAFGIKADGEYTISGDNIIITYDFLGPQVWKTSFSKDGADLVIAGTRFIKQ